MCPLFSTPVNGFKLENVFPRNDRRYRHTSGGHVIHRSGGFELSYCNDNYTKHP